MEPLPSHSRNKFMDCQCQTYPHAECTAKVIEDDPGARVASVIHDVRVGERVAQERRACVCSVFKWMRLAVGKKTSLGVGCWSGPDG